MVFLELLAHPDFLASPLAAFQVAPELLEIGDYQVHQVMSRTPDSFVLTNISQAQQFVHFFFKLFLEKKVLSIYSFTTSFLPVLFHSSLLSLPFSHDSPVPKHQFFLVVYISSASPRRMYSSPVLCLCFCHVSLLPPFFPP